MGNRDGEYIELWWEHEPDWEAVQGHVTDAEALQSIRKWCPREDGAGKVFVHLWAANLQTGLSRAMGLTSATYLYDQPGRGRYKVTALLLTDHEFAKAMA
jgi:hypothetical protein